MDLELVRERIAREFAAAKEARRAQNEGMVRVCARRAAGTAITYWLDRAGLTGWGMDAVTQLRTLQNEVSMPDPVRSAAARLVARVGDHFVAPFSADPLNDSRIIIEYLLGSR
jgi:hypothetical protein